MGTGKHSSTLLACSGIAAFLNKPFLNESKSDLLEELAIDSIAKVALLPQIILFLNLWPAKN